MKTRDLIAALTAEDPSGELQVSVGNEDIHFVGREPAYHDGCLQVLQRDPKKTGECYDVIGGEFRSAGAKVVIHSLSIKKALWNDPKMPITFDAEYARENYEKDIARWRREATPGKAHMDAVTELQQARVARHKANKSIGEPLIKVPDGSVFVTDEREVYMTMSGLISLVRDTIAMTPKE